MDIQHFSSLINIILSSLVIISCWYINFRLRQHLSDHCCKILKCELKIVLLQEENIELKKEIFQMRLNK